METMDSTLPQSNVEDRDKLCPSNRENLPPTMNNRHLQAPTQSKKTDDLASVMTIHECCQAFEEKDGDVAYSHTAIILRKSDEFFYAQTKNRYKNDDDIPLDELNVKPIHIDHIWPLFPRDTIIPDPLPINSCVKSPSLIYYDKDTTVEFSPK